MTSNKSLDKLLSAVVDVGVVPVYNKDKSKTYWEIDFVANKADQKVYIQTALSIGIRRN